jgi:hypothetical protein
MQVWAKIVVEVQVEVQEWAKVVMVKVVMVKVGVKVVVEAVDAGLEN